MSSSLTLKLYYNSDLRRMTVEVSKFRYSFLVSQIGSLYSINQPFTMKYPDEDGEWVTISNRHDLNEAIEIARTRQNNILKIYVSWANPKTATAVASPTAVESELEPQLQPAQLEESKPAQTSVTVEDEIEDDAAAKASPPPAAASSPPTSTGSETTDSAPASAPADSSAEENKPQLCPLTDVEVVDLLNSLLSDAEFKTALPQAVSAALDRFSAGDSFDTIASVLVASLPKLSDSPLLEKILDVVQKWSGVIDQALAPIRAIDGQFVQLAKSLIVHQWIPVLLQKLDQADIEPFYRKVKTHVKGVLEEIKNNNGTRPGSVCPFGGFGGFGPGLNPISVLTGGFPLCGFFPGAFGQFGRQNEGCSTGCGSASAATAASCSSPSSSSASCSSVSDEHPDVTCDICNTCPIRGLRYQCTKCHNFDLCSSCEAKNSHPADHPLMKLQPPAVYAAKKAEEDAAQAAALKDAVHEGVTCDGCNVAPIVGARFKCSVCHDFDLCASCEAKNQHDAGHPLIKMAVPAFRGRHGRGFHGRFHPGHHFHQRGGRHHHYGDALRNILQSVIGGAEIVGVGVGSTAESAEAAAAASEAANQEAETEGLHRHHGRHGHGHHGHHYDHHHRERQYPSHYDGLGHHGWRKRAAATAAARAQTEDEQLAAALAASVASASLSDAPASSSAAAPVSSPVASPAPLPAAVPAPVVAAPVNAVEEKEAESSAVANPSQPDEHAFFVSVYATQLDRLSQMGFNDTQLNVKLLKENGGNLGNVCIRLLEAANKR